MNNFNKEELRFKEILSDLDLQLNVEEIWNNVEERLTFDKETYRLPPIIWILSVIVLLPTLFLAISVPTIDSNDISTAVYAETVTSQSENTTTSIDVFRSVAAYEAAIDKVVSHADAIENTDDLSSSVLTSTEDYMMVHAGSELKPTLEKSSDIKIQEESLSQNFETSEIDLIANTILTQSIYDKGLSSSSMVNPSIDNNRLISELFPSKFPMLPQFGQLLVTPDKEQVGIVALNRMVKNIEPVGNMKSSPLLPFWTVGLGTTFGSDGYVLIDPELSKSNTKLGLERSLPGLSFDLTVGVETARAWRFFAVAGYSQRVHRFSDQEFEEKTETSEGVVAFVLDQNGNSSDQNGTVTSTALLQNDLLVHRYQNVLDLTIGLGKRIDLGYGMNVNFDAGLSLNISNRISGYEFAEDLSEVKLLSKNSDNRYKDKLGMGGFVSLSLEKQIRQDFSLSLRGQYKSLVNPINKEEEYNQLQIKNSQINLQFGITHRLRWE